MAKKRLLPKKIFELVVKKIRVMPEIELCNKHNIDRTPIEDLRKINNVTEAELNFFVTQFFLHAWKTYTREGLTSNEPKKEDVKPIIVIKRIKKSHGGGHSGSWKVAYADFVTAMMAFFLLMWLINMTPKEQKTGLADYFTKYSLLEQFGITSDQGYKDQTEIGSLATGRVGGDPWEQMWGKLKMEMEGHFNIRQDQIKIENTPQDFSIQVIDKEDSPMFKMGKSELNDWSREVLKMISESVMDIPNKISIEGHTDSTPFAGGKISNWDLSALRAAAARNEMEKNGIDQARFARIVGYSDRRLFIPSDSKDPRNRRISIIILKK